MRHALAGIPSTFANLARRGLVVAWMACWAASAGAADVSPHRLSITDHGALGDGTTLNTAKIQSTIDALAANGGGTVVVPSGTFVSGALFLKPGVNVALEAGAVLRCSTDLRNFPVQRTRIEGHFEDHFNPGLINANGCDGLHITGPGTLDGAGRPIWDEFWRRRNASGKGGEFRNLDVPRARLCVIENCRGVVVDAVAFKDAQFWNLHLYRCRDALVRGDRFTVPDDYKQAPSTDAIDVDSCQGVTVRDCYFSVTDDCVALKGSKGPLALDDKDSPPVEHVRVENCTYKRGNGVLTLGSEATVVRDVVVENCRVIGPVNVAVLKLRPDTPQRYEDIHFRGITLDSPTGTLLAIKPWRQYVDLKGQPQPRSVVRNVTLSDVNGRFGSLGTIQGNPGQTEISDVTLERIDVQLKDDQLRVGDVANLRVDQVTVNGKPYSP